MRKRAGEGREQARAEARAEARPVSAHAFTAAARRFGGATQPLAAFLESVDDAERLAEVGDWIADSATAAELIERVEAAG